MSRTHSPRLGEIREVFRLLNEIQELRHDPQAWQEHMIRRLCKLVGASQGTSLRWQGFEPGGTPTVVGFVASGWNSPKAAQLWEEAMRDAEWRGDPILSRAMQVPRRLATRLREQLVDDREWYGSMAFTDVGRMASIDHPLVAWYRRPQDGEVCGIAVHREWSASPFTLRERNILHLLNVELYQLCKLGKLDPPPDPAAKLREGLSPRQRDVLQRLMAGDSVKEAAVQLGLSRRTVEDYVKALHQRFEVHSRGALLAKFVRI